MVTTRSQHAERAQGSKGLPSLPEKIKARTAKTLALTPQNIPAAVQKHRALLKYGGSKQAARARVTRLQILVLGAHRVFSGDVYIPDPSTAREPDSIRLLGVAASMQAGHTLVYWCDGSAAEGFLGAGVAWTDKDEEKSKDFELGRYTGSSQDAELFAIAAALGQARSEVRQGRDIQLVRIYTDAQTILRALGDDTKCPLGPLVSRKTALEGVYERTDFLTNAGIKVELIWVKGHSNSRGNCLADQVANRAVKSQIKRQGHTIRKSGFASSADVPDKFKQMGQDWAVEWLYRANVHHGWRHKPTAYTSVLELSDDDDESAAPRAPRELQESGEDSAQLAVQSLPLTEESDETGKARKTDQSAERDRSAGDGLEAGHQAIPREERMSSEHSEQYDSCYSLDFVNEEHGSFSRTLDEVLFNLRNQRSAIDARIEKLQILIARNGGFGKHLQRKRQGFNEELQPLYEQLDHIQKEIEAAVQTKLARQGHVENEFGMVADEGGDEVEQGNDEVPAGDEQLIGHLLLEELEGIDDELESTDYEFSTEDEFETDGGFETDDEFDTDDEFGTDDEFDLDDELDTDDELDMDYGLDTDDELERQIRGDIPLVQRHN